MKRAKNRWIVALSVMAVPWSVFGQFNILGVTHGRTNAAITNGVTIGNIAVAPVGQAFQVRGDLLGAGNTGEVFKTDCPGASSTFWRMFSGGVAAGNERGRLFANTSENRFYINAPNNALRVETSVIPPMWSAELTVGLFG
jgi:hypothetical protein